MSCLDCPGLFANNLIGCSGQPRQKKTKQTQQEISSFQSFAGPIFIVLAGGALLSSENYSSLFPLPCPDYNNNQHKRFSDLFFSPVRWMSDGMTVMNGGEDTEAGLSRIWKREGPLIIYLTFPSLHNNVLCPNPIFTDCLTFYPLDISTLQLSSSVINHAFLVFGPNFLSFSMFPSLQFHSHITQKQTTNARESYKTTRSCVQCFHWS